MTITSEINPDLLLENYHYELPNELIADRPVPGRHHSKLMVYHESTGEITHDYFYNIGKYLPPSTLLVMNNSKVFPCRLFGKRPSGGSVELFILSLTPRVDGSFNCLIKTSRKKKCGDQYFFGEVKGEIVSVLSDGTFDVKFNRGVEKIFELASIPIPPYIRGGLSDEKDQVDYQTVYAKHLGSVAAPTAGLHFTDELLKQLLNAGIDQSFVTLHVGLGTFSPVKASNLLDHKMHSECFSIDLDYWNKITNHQGPIFAVGTTSLRCLESSFHEGVGFKKQSGVTNIFLHPGKKINSVQGLITNFHLPGSSLLMLVSALIGRETALNLYSEAIKKQYRFFSYGDAMLILRHD